MKKIIFMIVPICVSLLSCGPSKEELQKKISRQSDYIEELQRKLDNVRLDIEDVKSALEDGNFSDAYDAADDADDDAIY